LVFQEDGVVTTIQNSEFAALVAKETLAQEIGDFSPFVYIRNHNSNFSEARLKKIQIDTRVYDADAAAGLKKLTMTGYAIAGAQLGSQKDFSIHSNETYQMCLNINLLDLAPGSQVGPFWQSKDIRIHNSNVMRIIYTETGVKDCSDPDYSNTSLAPQELTYQTGSTAMTTAAWDEIYFDELRPSFGWETSIYLKIASHAVIGYIPGPTNVPSLYEPTNIHKS
jgi:hypothetical protein